MRTPAGRASVTRGCGEVRSNLDKIRRKNSVNSVRQEIPGVGGGRIIPNTCSEPRDIRYPQHLLKTSDHP